VDRKRLIGIVVVGCMLLITAACGQKPGVIKEVSPAGAASGLGGGEVPPGATIDPETGEVVDAAGNPVSTGTGSGSSGTGSSGTGSTGTGTSSGSGTGSGTSTGGGSPAAAGEPSGGNATGVSDDVIKIGIHAPLTGAAPVPSDSVEKGKDLYFRWLQSKGQKLNGREVKVVLKNDNYNPSQAVSVCKEMVEKDKVFLLSGAAGTDQIQACARYAASVGVPYISAGVTERGVTGLRNYFTTSTTYADQGPLLADLMASRLGAKGERNGLVFFDTPNFQDAAAAFKNGLKAQGVKLHYEKYVSKAADDDEAKNVIGELKAQRIKNVFVLTSPFWFIDLNKECTLQQYCPQWVGVGISMTFDSVATAACPGINGAQFFSPFPAWFDSKRYDADFDAAVRRFHPEENGGDDFMWLSWIGGKVIWEAMKYPGKNLTRERFIWFLERKRGIDVGIGPRLDYAPDNHFGAKTVYVNEARCRGGKEPADNKWHTLVSPPTADF
jgi:ABC-type branched-subunit amino acid transport system substrate-binding protein